MKDKEAARRKGKAEEHFRQRESKETGERTKSDRQQQDHDMRDVCRI